MIPRAFIQAAEEAVPLKEQKIPNFKVRKSPDWIKAEVKTKKINRKWVKAGKPNSLDNDIFNEQKQARAELRNSIKMHYSNVDVKDNNMMMNANFKDPQFFLSLLTEKGRMVTVRVIQYSLV